MFLVKCIFISFAQVLIGLFVFSLLSVEFFVHFIYKVVVFFFKSDIGSNFFFPTLWLVLILF